MAPAPLAPATSPNTVLVTTRSFGSGHGDPGEVLRDRGLDILRGDPGHDRGLLGEGLGATVAWIAGTGPIRTAHLELAPHLRVIARYGVGVDTVDVEAAAARGIVVTNTPGANTDAVADHAITLLLAALRQVAAGDRAARSGDWSPRRGRDMSALTVGVVGFGRVGRALAQRLRGGFGSRVLVHDPFVDAAEVRAAGCEPVALLELVAAVDALSLHVPGGERPVVDAALLAALRPGAILVNTARGDLIDEAAVAAALADGTVGALATDVLATEPANDSPLLRAPNVTITPHVAAQTAEAIDQMGTMAVDEVVRVLDGRPPRNPIRALTGTGAR